MKDIFYMLSELYRYFHFLSMFRQWHLSGVWLRAILVALMIPMAILGGAADQFFLNGVQTHNVKTMVIADRIFPFEKNFLTGEAETLVLNNVVNDETYRALKYAVNYDPYSARLLNLLMQCAFLMKDDFTAYITLAKINYMFPNSVKR